MILAAPTDKLRSDKPDETANRCPCGSTASAVRGRAVRAGLDGRGQTDEDLPAMSIAVLRQMFAEMVERKDATAIDRFYDPSFVMYSNGIIQDFEEFAEAHQAIYATTISYSVEYDEEAWVETADRVAARVWITTSRPGESPTRIEVILIAAFKEGRISRLWETTWPSWNTVPALEDY